MTFHKSAKGRVVNFDEMQHKNATTIAVGGANLNARGDRIGRNGEIIETVEARNAQSETIQTTTTRASVQSEISSLKAARSQWAGANPEPISNFEQEAVEVQEEEKPVEQPDAGKKKRTITESE